MSTRLQEALVMITIGDGVIGALFPARHASRWLVGPRLWRRSMRVFVTHPRLTQTLAAAEVAAGVWWAARLPPR